jgi:hypothetical protein
VPASNVYNIKSEFDDKKHGCSFGIGREVENIKYNLSILSKLIKNLFN